MASYEGETPSDCERRRARRRERRAERHAKKRSASPKKTDTTAKPHQIINNPKTERAYLPPAPPEYTESDYRAVHNEKELHRPIDSHPPLTIKKPVPVERTHTYNNRYDIDYLHDLQEQSYNNCHERRSPAYQQHKERYDDHRHYREKRQQRHGSRGLQDHDKKHRSYHSEKFYRSSMDDSRMEGNYSRYEDPTPRKWSRKKKLLFIVTPIILMIIIVLSVAIGVSKKHSFKYIPSSVQVTNSSAFENGGAARNANITDDGDGAGTDTYVYYSGPASNFPPKEQWVSFADMWTANKNVILQSCKILGYGKNDNEKEVTDIYNAIQSLASASLVDHRFILATILQESHGCLRTPSTNNGVKNSGLMQSHNGVSFSSSSPSQSILQMVENGTQGTKSGPGLTQHLNTYGNAYVAARMYNSGIIAVNGDLSDGAGATACYVSDIANRLTGWVYAKSTCPGDSS